MAFMTRCCCCCDLRTGVLLIGIVTTILSCYSGVNEVLTLNKLDDVKEYLAKHPEDGEKYGFTADMLDMVETMAKVSIGIAVVTAISSAILLIPACYSQRHAARPYRGALLVYPTWNIICLLYSFGYGAWILAKYTNPIVAAALIAGYAISIPLTIYFILVVIAFYIELGEDVTVVGGVIVQQPSNVPYEGFRNEQAPPYPGHQYSAKAGMI